jgi:thioredoxin-dependent adenylylsulfate APS reductase
MALQAVERVGENPISDDMLDFIGSGEAEGWSPQEILIWAIKNFAPRLALSCSFGAREGMVLLHMMQRIDPQSRVFTLDTGRIPQETYDLMDRVRDRFDVKVEVVFPRAEDVEAMVRQQGLNLFYESVEKRQHCCRIRKVEPLDRYLADVDAWVSGLRRDQNVTRTDIPKVEIDEAHGGIVKLNPIADWSEDQVLAYVREHNIPVNRLHGEGYPSVGCAPCSRAIAPGDDPRSGRWWWEHPETRECGIHVDEEDQGSGI